MKRLFAVLAMAVLVMATSLFSVYAQTREGWTVNLNQNLDAAYIAGQEVVFTARINNAGGQDNPATKVDFTIPKSSKFIGITGFENCLPLPNPNETLTENLTVTCDVPPLTREEGVTGKVIFTPQDAGTSKFSGQIPGDELAFQERTITVVEGADVALKLDVPGTVKSGGNLEFTAVVSNNGPHSSTSSTLTFPIPSGTVMNEPLPAGCKIQNNQIICEITGELKPGEERKLNFSAKVTAKEASTIAIEAKLVGNTPKDPDLDNDQDKANVTVEAGTDVTLGKARSPNGAVWTGDDVEFTLTPNFVGNEPETATITDTLPEQYKLVDFVAPPAGSGWVCRVSGQVVTCDYTKAVGTTFTTPITIKAEAVAVGNKVQNTANITSPDENQENTGNNKATDTAVNIVDPVIDLVAHKSGPRSDIVVVGNAYDFRLSTTNKGNANFSGELTITDHLPEGMEMTGIKAPDGWTCSPTTAVGPKDIICTTNQYTKANPLAPNAKTQEIILTAKVTEAGAYSNGMTVSFPGWNTGGDANPNDNTTSSGGNASVTDDSADIAVFKNIIGSNTIVAGDEMEFSIEIVNNGKSPARKIKVDDEFVNIIGSGEQGRPGPISPVTIDGVATGLTCAPTLNAANYKAALKCEIEELPVCKQGVDCPIITVKTTQGGTADPNRFNTAHVFSEETPDPNLGNNDSKIPYTVTPKTDVTIKKTSAASQTGTPAGQNLVYTIAAIVPRNGLNGADDVVVTDILPDGVYFVSATASKGSCSTRPQANTLVAAGNNTIICELGTINNGSQQVVTVTVKPTTKQVGNTLHNNASIETSTPETDTTNNKNSVDVEVLPPELNLIIQKTDDPFDPVTIGDQVTYTITATNVGPSNAHNVVITDTLPANGFHSPVVVEPLTSGFACLPSGTSTTTGGGTITCKVDVLEANSTKKFQIKMTAYETGSFKNNVSITSDEKIYETEKDDNKASEDTRVRARVDVGIVKSTDKTDVELYENFIWNLVVTNKNTAGYGIAEAVIVTDTLPAGMEFVSFPSNAALCTYAAGNREITCNLGDMNVGESKTLQLETKIISLDADAFTNTANVTTSSFDENEGNNDSSGIVKVKTGSVKGQIFVDLDDDKANNNEDKGLGGVTVTLKGTTEFDNKPFTMTVTTDANGNYDFTGVPSGTYEVSYGKVPDAGKYTAGSALPGTSSGANPSAPNSTTITGIEIKDGFASENNDFTLIAEPSIGLSKVAGAPVLNSDGTYTVEYNFTVKNLSLEPVQNIALTDALNEVSQNFGTNTSTMPPAEGEYIVKSVSANGGTLHSGFNGAGNNTIVSDAVIAPEATLTATIIVVVNPKKPWASIPLVLTNQATVEGTGQYSQKPATDKSDKNPGSEDDPSKNEKTTVELNGDAAITLEKTAVLVTAGSDAVSGDRIEYTFKVTNSGKSPLFDITIEDLLPDLIWDSNAQIDRLEAGESNDTAFKAHYILKQSDIENGEVKNSASTKGKWAENGGSPQYVDASDDADVVLAGKPGLSIVKEAVDDGNEPPSVVGDVITYKFTVTNTGNLTLTNVIVNDPLPGLDMPVNTVPTLIPGAANAVTLEATYKVTQADIEKGKVVNKATATGDYIDPVTKQPTPVPPVESEEITVPLGQKPALAIVKEAESKLTVPAEVGQEIVYTFTVHNTGNMVLENVTFNDPLIGLSQNDFTVGTLQPGENQTFTATYAITQDDIDAEQVENQAIAKGYHGDPNNPGEVTDPSGPTIDTNEPIIVPVVPPAPELNIIKTGHWNDTNGNGYPEVGETLEFNFEVSNPGNVILNNVTPKDDGPLFAGRPGANKLSAFTPTPVTLKPGESQIFKATYVLAQTDIDATAGIPDTLTNVALATGEQGNGKPYDSDESKAKINLPAAEPSLVTLTKQALLYQVRRGDRVPYIIKVENASSSYVGKVNVVDTMPSGFRYVVDSATVNGEKFSPEVNGRRIGFHNLELKAKETIEIRLELLVLSSAGPGKHVNIASVTDRGGNPIAPNARAEVEILTEAVFDCGDIIGTVFDDKNRNGYQDEGEKGLPGVRVATVKGWLITTDQYGRFHVPCAALPDQRIGSNFIMKLDTRTLPTGYRLTTENPRVVRLTAGKMTKLNFGASISRVVRLDLQAAAFENNSVALKKQWENNLKQLVDILKQDISVLRVTYKTQAGDKSLAKDRIKQVRKYIQELWKKQGDNYPLEIETRVEVGK